MTFLEAALEVLRREGKPLHYKDLAERAIGKKLLTFVGRTPEVTMQTQLTAAVKKAPGSPFVRVKPGVFGLLRYPELPPEPQIEKVEPKAESKSESRSRPARDDAATGTAGASAETAAERGRRRRRRGGRGRTRAEGAAGFAPNGHKGKEDGDGLSVAEEAGAEGSALDHADHDGPEEHEPRAGNLSAEARAAALAETGVLEGDDDGDDDADTEAGDHEHPPVSARSSASPATAAVGDDAGELGDDEGDDDEAEGALEAGATGAADAPREGDDADRTGRRRRRRRRRRHGEEGATPGAPGASSGFGPPSRASSAGGSVAQGERGAGPSDIDVDGDGEDEGEGESKRLSGSSEDGEGAEGSSSENRAAGGSSSEEPRERSAGDAGAESGDSAQGARRIMTPVDAAIEILRGQAPGRGVHVRQIADAAARRRLIHGEPNEAWRVMRTALAAEPRERLRAGQRPRVRSAGSGLFALARRPPDGELERAEQVFGEARRALRERPAAALERRIGALPAPAFEALARVLLQREGFGPATFVKRVEGTIYVEALRGRGSRPSKCLVGLRPGASSAGRRAIGELRAGIRARSQDEGVLLLGGRMAEDAIAEWKQAGPPVEIADGQAVSETCIRHGIGVINTMVSVDFVDADFFAELAEG